MLYDSIDMQFLGLGMGEGINCKGAQEKFWG